MKQNRIALKLSLYFAVSLMVLSLIVGSIFIMLFRHHTIQIYQSDLEKRAVKIANTLSEFNKSQELNGAPKSRHGNGTGYGAYVRFIGDIAGTDVWIIDENFNVITSMHNRQEYTYHMEELPVNASDIIKQVFQNKTIFSEDFSHVLSNLTLTVGTPILDEKQKVIGAVLLHSPVEGMNQAIYQGLLILVISISVALLISILLSIIFSLHFTKPLKRMNYNALKLAEGLYSCKNNINQNDEIGELAKTLDTLALQLEEAEKNSKQIDQMKHDFVANISHELKTPITVIRGSLEALIEEVVTDPAQIRHYHEQMFFETCNLQRLILDLLELSKLQNIEFLIEKQMFSISDLVEDVVKSSKLIAEDKKIEISMEIDDMPNDFFGDYGRLRQMLMIVLDNAIKFSKKDSIIEVSLQNKVLRIKDYGVGISDLDLPHIFEKFYKSRTDINKSGTGLGLAIAYQIASRHDIKITVNSQLGKGTEFIFSF